MVKRLRSKQSEAGGAILLALIVIVVGGILITGWIRTKPLHMNQKLHFLKYQARLLAESHLLDSIPQTIWSQLEFELAEEEHSEFFMNELQFEILNRGRFLGVMNASELSHPNKELWSSSVRLMTKENLRGDLRRVGDYQTHSQEDIEAGALSSEISIPWFQKLNAKLKSMSSITDSLTLKDIPEGWELKEGDVILGADEQLLDQKWVVQGKLIIQEGAQLLRSQIQVTEGLEISAGSKFQGRVMSYGDVLLDAGSEFEGYLATLSSLKEKANEQFALIRMLNAKFTGFVFALDGEAVQLDEDLKPALLKDAQSELIGYVMSPFGVELHGETRAFLNVYSLLCGSGNNCIGDLRLTTEDVSIQQPAWLSIELPPSADEQEWSSIRWKTWR